ncbi:MAG: hypothetical protein HRT94_07905 [Alphaproteobacteria bacterium]|nr:hypothetical protein [Alphaproteobacteria bacterium]
MSTTGFGQIPSSSASSAKNTNKSSKGDIVKIIRLPEGLQNNAKALRLEGTITQANNNGSVRIQTERGAIDVQFSNGRPPETGQQVSVNVPAGRPPRQVNVEQRPTNNSNSQPPPQQTNTVPDRPSLANQQPVQRPEGGQPAAPQQNSQQPAQTAARPPQAPLPPLPQAGQTAAQPQTNSFPPAPLTEGTQVRLTSLPPHQANQIIQQSLNALTPINNIVTKTAFTANLIAQNAASTITQNTLNILTPNPALNLTTPIQNTLISFITNIAQPTQITPQISLTPIAAQSATPNVIVPLGNVIQPQAGAALPTQGSIQVFQPNGVLLPTITSDGQVAGKIDVQVLEISNGTVRIVPPATNNVPSPLGLTQITPPVTSTNTATTVTGQVTGFTPQGQPLVSLQLPNTPLPQNFVLQYTPNNITIGAQIKIAVQNVGLIPTPATTALQSPAMNTMLQGFQWAAFDDMVQTFLQQSPQNAAALLRNLPTPANPAQLGAIGLTAMAAVRSGDFSILLGDKKIEALQRLTRGSNLISRMSQDTSAPRLEAASSSDWRAVPLPMFWEGEIHKITLFTRQEQDNQNKQDNENGSTRFIFDLSLSRMGDVQLDGYIKEGRLDLVVRTQNPFSAPMQQKMRRAYAGAISQAGLNGDLTFQGHTKNWVHVIKSEENFGTHA